MQPSLTYGEIIPGQLARLLSNHRELTTFIDLGSGKGNLCMEACSISHLQSVIGLELLPDRIAQSLKLKKEHSNLMKHCQFYLHDLCTAFTAHKTPALAYLCATCFTIDLLEKLSVWLTDDKLIKSIITLKPLPLNATYWKVSKIGMVFCTWDSTVYYQYDRA
jgi:hypothetical protein